MNKFRKARWERTILYSILGGAFLVRIWGIEFGLPQKHIIDEQSIVYSAFYSAAHNLRPFPYLHAPLQQYIILFEYGVYFLFGRLLGIFATPFDFAVAYLSDPTTLFLIGRVTTAIFGIATVGLVWRIGEKFFNKRIGFIAAFFLALSFLHVKESHYIKEDVLAGFFVLSAFYFALHILIYGKAKHYFLAGASLALAVSSKYPSGLMLPVVLFAHFLQNRSLSTKLMYLISGGIIMFLLVNPYLLIDPRGTVSWVIAEFIGNKIEYTESNPIWWWFLTQHLPNGIGFLIFVAAMLGFVVCILKAFRENVRFLFIPFFPLIFLATIDFWTQYHSARFAIMVLPFFALSAAIFLATISTIVKGEKKKLMFLILASAFFVFQPLGQIIKFNTLITRQDTRVISAQWFEQTIPPGSTVLIESTLKPEIPSNLNIPLNLDKKAVESRINDARLLGLDSAYLNALQDALKGTKGFKIIATPRVDIRYDLLTNESVFLRSAEYYAKSGVEYLVLSSWAIKPDISQEFERSMSDFYELIYESQPTYKFTDDPHFIELDYSILDKVNPFDKDLVFGPIIQVYKMR